MSETVEETGVHTLAEIKSQADSWAGVFARVDDQAERLKPLCTEADEVVVTGCGSGFNIANAVAPVFQRISGKTCRPVHASDLMLNPDAFLNPGRTTLAIGYSRSGDTTESVAALARAAQTGAATVAVVCFERSRMAQSADVALVLEEAIEKSITTTRSMTAMVLTGYYLAATSSGNETVCADLKRLPAIARQRMDVFHALGQQMGNDCSIRKYAFLGSGGYYGLAREAQLKIKEMVLLPSDAYVSLDYQHGPMSNVDEQMLVTILVSDVGAAYDLALARKMKSLGGKVLVLCDRDTQGFADVADYLVELNTGLSDGVRDILYMPVMQFMAYYRSLSVGCDPDRPKNLLYHVELDEALP